MTRFSILALSLLLPFSSIAFATEGNSGNGKPNFPNGHDNRAEKSVKQAKPSQNNNQAQAQGQTQGQVQAQKQGQRQVQSAVGTGYGGAGGAGGSASANNGGQFLTFSPTISTGGAGSGLEGKINPDVSPPSMPAVAPCTVGWSVGTSFAGVGLGGGGYTSDVLCGWERQHALETAVGNHDAAKEIRQGMTMMRCKETPPEDRKFFKACDAFNKEQGEQAPNAAFNSAG